METELSCFLTSKLAASILLFSTATPNLLFPLFIVLILLVCSALVSGSEVAYFGITHNDIEELKQEKEVSGERVVRLVEKPRYLLATILIANNFINIAIAILSSYVLMNAIPDNFFLMIGKSLAPIFTGFWEIINTVTSIIGIPITTEVSALAVSNNINFVVNIVCVTFILVLFGEVAPKVYAKLNGLKLARFMSRPLTFLDKLFYPLSNILVKSTQIIEKRLESRTAKINAEMLENIDDAIDLTVSHEIDSAKDVDILKSIVKFSTTSVKQVMRSRVDVIAIDFRMDFKTMLKIMKEAGFSRYPVYDEDFDNIMGLLYTKDLLPYLEEDENFEWQELIRTEVIYVPESKKISDLLKIIQEKRTHMVIVVDEYGGSSGIVTLEDIMEEVIGEIKDEFDADAEIDYEKIDEHNYAFEGKTMLNDVCRVVGISTDAFDEIKGDSDSVAGLVIEVLGRIPKKDVEIKYQQYILKVLSANHRRVEKVQLTLLER